jgi:DNA-binding NarL/FixJ family response regulator
MDKHQSILALHEFESSPINRDHFLYWGSVFKHFPVKGSSKSGQTLYTIIQVHVIEHTVFYQDETSKPFPNCGNYRKRIIGSLESPGKVSYKSQDELDVSSGTQQYPSKKLSKVPKGYVVVIDVSQIGTAFDAQLQRAEQTLDYLAKHKLKFIIVASKCDDSNPNSLKCVQDLKRKYHTILVETSASGNVNVRDAFRLLAHKVLKKSDISDNINSFVESQQNALKARSYAKRAFQEFLEEQVVDPTEQLHGLCEHSEFRECNRLTGKFDTGWLFATHILQLYNEEYSNKEDADRAAVTRKEYLENVIKERPDLFSYSHHLKRFVYVIYMVRMNGMKLTLCTSGPGVN